MTDPLAPMSRVAAYAVAVEGDRILLVRIAPGYTRDADGKWTLPGGGLNFGEDPHDGMLRELAEETGLIGESLGLAFVHSVTRGAIPDEGFGPFHAIRIAYNVRITGGELRHEKEESTDMAAWVPIAETAALPKVDLVDEALRYLETRGRAFPD